MGKSHNYPGEQLSWRQLSGEKLLQRDRNHKWPITNSLTGPNNFWNEHWKWMISFEPLFSSICSKAFSSSNDNVYWQITKTHSHHASCLPSCALTIVQISNIPILFFPLPLFPSCFSLIIISWIQLYLSIYHIHFASVLIVSSNFVCLAPIDS